MKDIAAQERRSFLFSTIVVVVIIGLLLWGIPQWNIYKREMSGQAQLKEAEWNRQIAVEEARAEKEAASLKKDADIIRAEGIAEANKIIAKSLTPQYITWKWVEGLHDGKNEVIYVPTEANLPILEAVRNV